MKNLIKAINYRPGTISFAEGFKGPKGNVGFSMVADYEKAKNIIEKLLSEGKKIDYVEMGLDGDWGENSMIIWEDNSFEKYNLYDNSIWAEPIIIVNYKDSPSETYSVWSKQ